MPKDIPYASVEPDEYGYYPYSAEDDLVWRDLFDRQMRTLPGKVVPEYLDAIVALNLSREHTPQVVDIDRRLNDLSGAGVHGVPAIIPPTQFFTLLSQRKFPVATFLRRREDMDYIEEPDLFHEVFGHCPLLTNCDYADFIEGFGKLALSLGKGYSWHLFRLFWFTVEFGMIATKAGPRAYGAGIVSSPAELAHATSPNAKILPFNLPEVLRTPYRIDIVQPVYFEIQSFTQLAALLECDLKAEIDAAKAAGDFEPMFKTSD